MSRKRDDGAAPPQWGIDRAMRSEAPSLVGADDASIEARAKELGCDPARLRAYVNDARRRARLSRA